MDDYQKIIVKTTALQYKINYNDKMPRSFGTSELLYQSEIHFIDAIGIDSEINATQLSKKLSISNGAITQVADKLVKKKMMEKYKKESNKKEIYFRLTAKGAVAYESHKNFHQEINEKTIAYLKSLSPEQIEGILGYITIADETLPSLSLNK